MFPFMKPLTLSTPGLVAFVCALGATPSASQDEWVPCELVPPTYLAPGESLGVTPMPPGTPLMVIPNWDASLLATIDGP